MKKFLFLTVIALITSSNTSYTQSLDKNILATYGDGEVITKDDFLNEYKFLNGGQMPSNYPTYESIPVQMKETILRNMALGKIILKEAEKAGFTETDQMKAEFERMKRNIIQNQYMQKVLDDNLNKVDLRKAYDKEAARIASQMLVDYKYIMADEESIKKAYAELDKRGKNFDEIFKKYSMNKANPESGIVRNILIPSNPKTEYDNVIVYQKVDEVSKPIDMKSAWVIIKIENRHQQKPPKFEEIIGALKSKAYQDIREKYISELTKVYNLNIKTENINVENTNVLK